MAGLQIPLKAGASGAAVAYDTAVDGSYNIFSAALKNYPVTNAFVDGADTSQEKWGLQVTNRTAQNNIFKGQLSYGVASGTGALSRKSITYPFTKTIVSLDSGNVQTAIYQNGFPTVTLDETNKVILNTKTGGYATAVGSSSDDKVGFVATNTNKFLCVGNSGGVVKVYSVNANYAVTGLASSFTISGRRTWVVAAKNQYVWVVSCLAYGGGAGYDQIWYGGLYSCSSAGVLTLVGSEVTLGTVTNGNQQSISNQLTALGSYVVANTCHLFCEGTASGNYGMRIRFYNTINMSTVSGFTTTQVKVESANGLAGNGTSVWSWFNYGYTGYYNLNVGFDGTQLNIVTNLGTAATPDIYQITNSVGGWVDTTVNAFANFDYHLRYTKTTALQSTQANNVLINNSTINIKGTTVVGTYTNLHQAVVMIYEMDGTIEQDAAAGNKGYIMPCTASANGSGNDLVLKLNGTTYLTKTLQNTINWSVSQNFTVTYIAVGASKLNFELYLENSDGDDMKIGFGLSGGTYAAPTGNYETSTINVTIA